MNAVFVKLVNMSVSAAWLILAVLLLRLVLKKAPRWITCLLWALVAVRLACPVSIHSPVSAYQVTVPEAVQESGQVAYFQYVHESGDKPSIMLDVGAADETAPDSGVQASSAQGKVTRYLPPYVTLWLAVGTGLVLYGLFSTVRLRYRTREAMHLRENVWVCDTVTSPFLLGVLRPRIYLPSGMDEGEMAHVLAHERAHLRRGDHMWKPLGYLLLAVHWFNPLVWLAYWLFCRDVETACDQRVVRGLDLEGRKAYSAALLACSQGRRIVLACPLAFGEVGVRSRIKSVLHYKKPAFWMMLAAVVLCVVVAVCFLTDPLAKENGGTAGTLCAVASESVGGEYRADFTAELDGAALDMIVYADVWGGGRHTLTRRLSLDRYTGAVSVIMTEGSGASLVRLTVTGDGYGAYDSVSLPQPETLSGAAMGRYFAAYEAGEILTVRAGDEIVLSALALDFGGGIPVFDCHALNEQPEAMETALSSGGAKIAEQADYMVVVRAVFTDSTTEAPCGDEESMLDSHTLLLSTFRLPDAVALSGVAENEDGIDLAAFMEQERWTMAQGEVLPIGAERRIVLQSGDGAALYIESGTDYLLWHHPDTPEKNLTYTCGMTGDEMINALAGWAWDMKRGIARSQETVPDAETFFLRFPEGGFRWDIYENSGNDPMALFDLLHSSIETDGVTEARCRALLMSVAGLDGAYSEGYASLLAAACEKDSAAYRAAWRGLTYRQQCAVPSDTEGILPQPEAIRWSYDSGVIETPYMTVNGGGTVFYMEVPEELAQRIRQRVAENVTLSGFTAPQFTNGWQRDLISWSAEKAEVHLVFAGDYSEFYTLCRGETRLWGLDTGESVVEADGEVRELLAMIAALTGWETDSGREAFTGLTMAELVYNGKTLYTVTDAQHLGSLQNLLQNGTQASFASKTPMERVELRMTRSDGTTVSVLLDTDSPRIFLPPFHYYEYNDYESTDTLPLLEVLGLNAWPEETGNMDCSTWLNKLLAELVSLPSVSDTGSGAALLTEEQVLAAAEQCGLTLTLQRSETQQSESSVTYTMRDDDALWTVTSSVYNGEKRYLQALCRISAGEDTDFRWENWQQLITLAGVLYGDEQDGAALYDSLSAQDIPADAADGAAWLLETPAGYCRALYTVTTVQGRPTAAMLTVMLYEDEMEYRETMRQAQENRDNMRQEQSAMLAG